MDDLFAFFVALFLALFELAWLVTKILLVLWLIVNVLNGNLFVLLNGLFT